MHKVLWVCGLPPKEIAENAGLSISNGGGWIHGYFDNMKKSTEFRLSVCFPIDNQEQPISGKVGGITYHSFYQRANMAGISDAVSVPQKMCEDLSRIVQLEKPDILHIFGTENAFSLCAFRVFSNSRNTVLHIQGLTSVCADYYDAGLPFPVLHRIVPSTVFRGTIAFQKRVMRRRGKAEEILIKESKNVMGRTDWDEAHCKRINKKVRYFHCGEILRNAFYCSDKWMYQSCEKHTLFMPQGPYPIKGLHTVIEALNLLKQDYPDVCLSVAGNSPIKDSSLKGKLAISSYGVYLRSLINKYGLERNLSFLGALSEPQMAEHMLKANVFVMASYIENSPNSLGEAMLLGLPCVASDVGGVASMLEHRKEGFLFQHNDPGMLAYYISKVFDSGSDIEATMSAHARARANINHSVKENVQSLHHIYREILQENHD